MAAIVARPATHCDASITCLLNLSYTHDCLALLLGQLCAFARGPRCFPPSALYVFHKKSEPIDAAAFRSQVDRLMDMIVNSLYSNREVFLRELISNASDALDKMRYLSLTDAAKLAGRPDLEIRVSADKEKNTITIE